MASAAADFLRVSDLHAFYGEYLGVRIARKHLAWYCRDRPGAAAFRTAVNGVESADVQLTLTRYFCFGGATEPPSSLLQAPLGR